MSIRSNNTRAIELIMAEQHALQPEYANVYPSTATAANYKWATITELFNDYLMCKPVGFDPADDTIVSFPIAKIPELRHAQQGLAVTTIDTNHIQVNGNVLGVNIAEDWYAVPAFPLGGLIQYAQGIDTGITTEDAVPVSITLIDLNVAARMWAALVATGGA